MTPQQEPQRNQELPNPLRKEHGPTPGESLDLQGHVPAREEASFLNIRTIAFAAVGLIGLILIVHLLSGGLWVLFGGPDNQTRPEKEVQSPGPQLQANPVSDLAALKATERARIETYGWVNKPAGIIQIPVERAIELLAEQGLPVAPTAGP